MSILVESDGSGTFVVPLRGFTPGPRSTAAGAWTTVRIDEAASEGGTVVGSGTAALLPADTDPEEPQSRDFTLTGATLTAGWYRVTFLDGDGNEQSTEWVFNGPPIRPSVGDIGTLLHAYTTTEGSGEAGTFNDDTDPTGTQVERFIDIAVGQVAIQLPDDLTAKQTVQARAMVAYLTAILVLNSHFSDQVESGDTLASMYQDFYDKGMIVLTGSLEGDLPGGPSAFAITTPTDFAAALDASGRTGCRHRWGW